MNTKQKTISDQAQALGLDLERHMRQERLNGHLSPTDSAVLQRISSFLLKTLPQALAADDLPASKPRS